MPISRQIVQSLLGVNADDSYKVHTQADAASMVNTRIVDFIEGDTGDIQNVLGNTEISNTLLETGINTCIGAVSFERDNKIFFFVHNSTSSKHAIYVYNGSSFIKLVSNSQFVGSNALGFQRSRITAAAIVNDFLVYSTGVGEVRAIDVDYWTNNTPSGLDNDYIYLIVRPPLYSPQITETTGDLNVKLSRQFLRFHYRFVYLDGRISAASPASVLKNVHDTEVYNLNEIIVTIPFDQKIHTGVETVQFIGFDGESSTYFIASEKKGSSAFSSHNAGTTALSIDYTAKQVYQALPSTDVEIIQGLPPYDVKTIAAAKNRLFFANYKDGLDMNTTYTQGLGQTPSIQYQLSGTTTPQAFMEGSIFDIGVIYRDQYGRTNGVTKLNVTAEIPYRDSSGTDSFLATVQQYEPTTAHELKTTIADFISFDLETAAYLTVPSWAKTAEVVISDNRAYSDFIQFNLRSDNAVSLTSTGQSNGVKYQFGLRYAIKQDDGTYKIANSKKYLSDTYSTESIEYYALSLRDAIANGLGWDYVDGDFVRVVLWRRNFASYQGNTGQFYEEYVEGEIIAEQDGHLIFKIQDFPQLGGTPDYLGYTNSATLIYEDPNNAGQFPNNYLCNYGVATIFRKPNISDFINYHETGLVFDATSLPTVCKIKGDCSITGFDYKEPWSAVSQEKTYRCINSHGEQSRFVRLYRSYFGRSLSFIEWSTELLNEQKTTAITFSGTYTNGTKNNNLNYVDITSEEVLPADLSGITKLQLATKVEEVGTVMLAIGEDNTASIYIGESQLTASGQNADLVINNNVIGSVNILRGGYGTTYPESVVERNGFVYFVDLNKGAAVRYGQDGLFEISNYKYTSVLKDIARNKSSKTQIIGGFDPLNEEYLVSVLDPYKSVTNYISDHSVSTVYDDAYDFDTPFSLSLSTGSKDVITVAITPDHDVTGLRIKLDSVVVFDAGVDVYPANETIYARFLGNNTLSTLTITGIGTDSGSGTDADILITNASYDFSTTKPTIPVTHSFAVAINRWRGYDTYMPEAFVSLTGELYSFKEGKLYKHNNSSGVQYYGNAQSPAFGYYLDNVNGIVNLPVSHQIQGSTAPSIFRLTSETHATELSASDYAQSENIYKASFKRDKLTTANMLSGKRLRGSKLLSLFTMPANFRVERILTDIKDSTGH